MVIMVNEEVDGEERKVRKEIFEGNFYILRREISLVGLRTRSVQVISVYPEERS